MSATTIDWDQDVEISKEESCQSLQNALNRNQGFGLYFVRSSPVQIQNIIEDIKRDLPNKNIGILPLTDEVDNLFNLITNFPDYQNLNILFISGLELSLLRYEERESEGLFLSSQSAVYGGTWAGVPRILGHLNLSRERFREHFPFSIVFCLPEFALRYFIRRAPDFFDWRSGVYEFPTELETLNLEALNLLLNESQNLEKYQTWTEQERLQRLTGIRTYLSESPDLQIASELWFEKGLIHVTAGEYQDAITAYDHALQFQTDYHEAWFNKGIIFSKLGRLEEAITAYDHAITISGDHDDTFYNRGVTLGKLGRMEEAIADFEQAIMIKPNNFEAWINRGIVLCKLKRLEEGITSFDKAIQIKFDVPEAWYNRGRVLSDLDRYEEALLSYEKAINIQPNYANAWLGKANQLISLKRNEEALLSYKKAIEIEPNYAYAWTNMGLTLANLDRYDDAITSSDKAIEIAPNDPSIWYSRGITLIKLGEEEESINCLEKSLVLEFNKIVYDKAIDVLLEKTQKSLITNQKLNLVQKVSTILIKSFLIPTIIKPLLKSEKIIIFLAILRKLNSEYDKNRHRL
jgi:tetratricopeptide (TPR) repeat protein